ncbi:hypothetical protein FSP39_004981 [Pinctada imbricata]|uniref:Uncharacterized protein n=1 Tax=Pinctada imbricata TaxID=66713 RepID=A0AA89CCI4_PINIB|nr:hypothetical protein FSP39_004981 [Pinctada imbricata]
MADKSFISLPMVLLDIYADMTGKDLNQSVAESKYHDTVRIIGEKVKFNKELAKNVFEEAKRGIVDFVKDCLYKKNIDMKITSIIIVGGFASSNRIVEAVREACPNHRVVVPLEPDIAVLKGATIYGHVPRIIMSRISRYTYGIGVLNTFIQGQHPEDKRVKKNGTDLCKDVFEKFVEAGRKVPSEGLDREYDITFAHKPLELQMFVTSDQRPVLTSDTGCLLLGKICVELPTGGWKTDATVSVRIYFGGTEIHVMARDSQKDFLYEANYDFL